MAEYIVVHRDNALPLHNEISDEVAAILESVAVGVHAVNKIGDVKDKNIVIIGPGPIGLGIAVICRGLGASKVLVAGLQDDEKRLEIAKKINVAPVQIEPNDFSNLERHLHDKPADVIFDCSGNPSVPEKAIHLVKKGGEIILVGISTSTFSVPLDCVVRGEIGLKGTYGTNKKSFLQAINYARLPKFPFESIITDKFKLEDAVTAFEVARTKRGKILLYP